MINVKDLHILAKDGSTLTCPNDDHTITNELQKRLSSRINEFLASAKDKGLFPKDPLEKFDFDIKKDDHSHYILNIKPNSSRTVTTNLSTAHENPELRDEAEAIIKAVKKIWKNHENCTSDKKSFLKEGARDTDDDSRDSLSLAATETFDDDTNTETSSTVSYRFSRSPRSRRSDRIGRRLKHTEKRLKRNQPAATKITQLQRQIQKLEKQNASLVKEVQGLKNGRNPSQLAGRHVQKSIDTREQVTQLSTERNTIVETVEGLRQDFDSASRHALDLHQEIAMLKDRLCLKDNDLVTQANAHLAKEQELKANLEKARLEHTQASAQFQETISGLQKNNDTYLGFLEEFRTGLQQQEETIRAKHVQIGQVTSERDLLTTTLENLENDCKTVSSRLVDLQQNAAVLNHELLQQDNIHTAQLDAHLDSITELTYHLAEARRQHGQDLATIADLHATNGVYLSLLEQFEKASREQAQKIDLLESANTELTEHSEELESKCETTLSENHAIRRQAENEKALLEEQISQAAKKINVIAETFTERSERIAILEKALAESARDLNLSEEVEKILIQKLAIARTKTELAKADSEESRQALANALQKFREDLAAAQATIISKEVIHSAMNAQLIAAAETEFTALTTTKDREIAELNSALTASQLQRTALEDQRATQEKTIEQVSFQLAKAEDAVLNLADALTTFTETSSSLVDKNESAERTIADLQEQLEESHRTRNALTTKLAELSKNFDGLIAEERSAEALVKDLQSKLATVLSDRAILTGQIENLQSAAKSDTENFAKEVASLQETIQTMGGENRKLATQLADAAALAHNAQLRFREELASAQAENFAKEAILKAELIAAAETEFSALTATKDREIAELNSALTASQLQRTALEDQRSVQEEKIAQVSSQLAKAEDAVLNLADALTTFTETSSSLVDKNESAERTIADLQEQLEKAHSTRNALATKLAELSENFDDLITKEHSAEALVKDLQSKLATVLSDNATLTSAKNNETAARIKAEEEITTLNQCLAALTTSIEASRSKEKVLQAEQDQQKTAIAQLSSELEKAETTTQKVTNELSEITGREAAITIELQEKKELIENLNAALNTAQTTAEDAQRKHKEILDALTYRTEGLNEVEDVVGQLEAVAIRLSDTLTATQSQIKALEESKEEQQASIANLEKNLAAIQEKATKLETEKDVAEGTIGDLTAKLEAAIKTDHTLNAELTELRKTFDALHIEAAGAREALQKTSDKLDSKSREYSAFALEHSREIAAKNTEIEQLKAAQILNENTRDALLKTIGSLEEDRAEALRSREASSEKLEKLEAELKIADRAMLVLGNLLENQARCTTVVAPVLVEISTSTSDEKSLELTLSPLSGRVTPPALMEVTEILPVTFDRTKKIEELQSYTLTDLIDFITDDVKNGHLSMVLVDQDQDTYSFAPPTLHELLRTSPQNIDIIYHLAIYVAHTQPNALENVDLQPSFESWLISRIAQPNLRNEEKCKINTLLKAIRSNPLLERLTDRIHNAMSKLDTIFEILSPARNEVAHERWIWAAQAILNPKNDVETAFKLKLEAALEQEHWILLNPDTTSQTSEKAATLNPLELLMRTNRAGSKFVGRLTRNKENDLRTYAFFEGKVNPAAKEAWLKEATNCEQRILDVIDECSDLTTWTDVSFERLEVPPCRNLPSMTPRGLPPSRLLRHLEESLRADLVCDEPTRTSMLSTIKEEITTRLSTLTGLNVSDSEICAEIIIDQALSGQLPAAIQGVLSQDDAREFTNLAHLIYWHSAIENWRDPANPRALSEKFAPPEAWNWLNTGLDSPTDCAHRLLQITGCLRKHPKLKGSPLTPFQVQWARKISALLLSGTRAAIYDDAGAGKTDTADFTLQLLKTLLGSAIPEVHWLSPFASETHIPEVTFHSLKTFSGDIVVPVKTLNAVVFVDEAHKLVPENSDSHVRIVLRNQQGEEKSVDWLSMTATPVVPAIPVAMEQAFSKESQENHQQKVEELTLRSMRLREIRESTLKQLQMRTQRARLIQAADLIKDSLLLKDSLQLFNELKDLNALFPATFSNLLIKIPEEIKSLAESLNKTSFQNRLYVSQAQEITKEILRLTTAMTNIREEKIPELILRKSGGKNLHQAAQPSDLEGKQEKADQLFKPACELLEQVRTLINTRLADVQGPYIGDSAQSEIENVEEQLCFHQQKLNKFTKRNAQFTDFSELSAKRRPSTRDLLSLGFSEEQAYALGLPEVRKAHFDTIDYVETAELAPFSIETLCQGLRKTLNRLGEDAQGLQLICPGVRFTSEHLSDASLIEIASAFSSKEVRIFYHDSHSEDENLGKNFLIVIDAKGALKRHLLASISEAHQILQKGDAINLMLYDSTNQQGGDFGDFSKASVSNAIDQIIFFNLTDNTDRNPSAALTANDAFQAIRRRRGECSRRPVVIGTPESLRSFEDGLNQRQTAVEKYYAAGEAAYKISKRLLKIAIRKVDPKANLKNKGIDVLKTEASAISGLENLKKIDLVEEIRKNLLTKERVEELEALNEFALVDVSREDSLTSARIARSQDKIRFYAQWVENLNLLA